MKVNKRKWRQIVMLCLAICLWFVGDALAQAPQPGPRLVISGSDVSSPPNIELHVYGMDEQGNALDLRQEPLTVRHEGVPVATVDQATTRPVGAFTVFLLDVPTGVAEQVPAVQAAVNQFANAPTMMEQVDAVAVYEVDATAARELLAPTGFHNSVRNLFATPLSPETGATALVDSIGSLLEQVESLKPDPAMVASIVLFTDGTDAVSTRFQADEIPAQAARLGIPIHTVWLRNAELSPAGQQLGQTYLANVAAQSRGLAAQMDNEAQVAAIWNRIAGFREHTRVRYAVENLTGGTYTVEINLTNRPEAQVMTDITVPGNLPSIIIDLPPESRVLTLPDVDRPVRLRFPTSVTWLDGVGRQLTAAQLVVNGAVVQDIPVRNIGAFEAEIGNLAFGDNVVQIVALDEQGMRVTSPPLVLTVNQGSRNVPAQLETGRNVGRVLLQALAIAFVLALLAGLIFLAWQTGFLTRLPEMPRGGRRRREPAGHPPGHAAAGAATSSPYRAIAYLEVLEAISQVPPTISLTSAIVRLGRSPNQANIAFENDVTVSRLHASLMLEGNSYRIFDENSTSGTWINERQVPEYGTQLMDGDEIHLGAVHLRFRQPLA